ncbi:MAG: DUF1638 domain-containing protein [Candidatus Promineifilaceae bacterium]|nr:DUF1638 domain-containing protein [Candidatus Promineifilaceae bacterium]
MIVACQVLQSLIESLLPPETASKVIFKDYGLHRLPNMMRSALQETIDGIEMPSLVVLGYGLCGNGLKGLKAGKHTLLVPRADDCIAILLGSRERYLEEFAAEPGTYYLSKGWLECGSHPMGEYEEYVEVYGQEEAEWVMDMQYQHYRRLVLVAHSEEDMARYRPEAAKVARYCTRWNMRYEEIMGSERYVRRLLEAASEPEAAGDEFLVVKPGGEIRQDQFV